MGGMKGREGGACGWRKKEETKFIIMNRKWISKSIERICSGERKLTVVTQKRNCETRNPLVLRSDKRTICQMQRSLAVILKHPISGAAKLLYNLELQHSGAIHVVMWSSDIII